MIAANTGIIILLALPFITNPHVLIINEVRTSLPLSLIVLVRTAKREMGLTVRQPLQHR
jgi:hypothetical protein